MIISLVSLLIVLTHKHSIPATWHLPLETSDICLPLKKIIPSLARVSNPCHLTYPARGRESKTY